MSERSVPLWAEITIPPRVDMVRPVQDVARRLAERGGFDAACRARIELAVEEVVQLLLRCSFDEAILGEGDLSVRCEVAPPLFRVRVADRGMPFELGLVPHYTPPMPDAPNDGEDDAGRERVLAEALSLRLLEHCVDEYRVVNEGRNGTRFEMAWFLPYDPFVEGEGAGAPETSKPEDDPLEGVRVLDDRCAVQVARLVFRGYGYSYVYEDIYYPDRLREYYRAGLVKSWGAVTRSGRLVGHLALLKETVASEALEWGVAVVDPEWRGRRLMQGMLEAAIADTRGRTEPVLCAHAVTAHPYTQKTCVRFGFHPTALLIGYAPATLRFRGIDDGLKQRESTILAVRCLRPLPQKTLHLPRRHARTIRRLLRHIDALPEESMLVEADEALSRAGSASLSVSMLARCVNAGRIQIKTVGDDIASVVRYELRRFCLERADVIYLTIDLADPGSGRAVRAAEECGFFLAGISPMMEPAYGLTFQYLNNFTVDFDAIRTYGEEAEWLKHVVREAYGRMENSI